MALRNLTHRLWRLPRSVLISLISGYQQTLSPDHGPLRQLYPYGYCRHQPTCSEYAKQQLANHGAVVGTAKAAWRILHCNPFARPSDERLMEAVKMSNEKAGNE